MANKQEYTGTFIPAYIMLDEELSPTEKILYAEIASFKTCYASNAWFAKRLGVSSRTITAAIAKLGERDYIIALDSDPNNRTLIARHNAPPSKIFHTPTQNLLDPHAKFANIDKHKNKKEKLPPAPPVDFDGGDTAAGGDTPPTVRALYYRVIKKYELPTYNHGVLEKKIKALETEVGTEGATRYLNWLLDNDYKALPGDFKPGLSISLDPYTKRVMILNWLTANHIKVGSPKPMQKEHKPWWLQDEEAK